jgi:hypothetical protein
MGSDDEDEWDDDPEGPSAEDRRRFGGATIPCPSCRRPIHDESVSCPHCGHWLEEAAAEPGGRTKRRVAIGVVLAVALAGGGFLWWLLRALI